MEQFKIKPTTKRSSTNINSTNSIPNATEKRLELSQNTHLINVQENIITEQANGQSIDLTAKNPPTLLRNPSLRPRSGVARNMAKNSKAKELKSNDEMIQERIKQKMMANTIGDRPLTSGMNQTSGLRYQKRQKILSRKAINSNNTVTLMHETSENQSFPGVLQQQAELQCVSNEQVLSIMLQIIDGSVQYDKFRSSNEQQFMKIRQKLISNVSIIVLKWYKILQDQLFNQVKKLGCKDGQKDKSNRDSVSSYEQIPQTIEDLVQAQIRKQFSVKNGLFAIEQRCSQQQTKLSMLIDGRLERLGCLLQQSTARTMQKCV